jgi:hypothetical protein
MTDQQNTQPLELADVPEVQERRAFLRGLGKWSQAVIGGVLLGGGLMVSHRASAGGWINRRGGGGGWINNRGGYGGGAWVNR